MVDSRLINFIKLELSKGVPVNQIKQSLLMRGWSENVVTEAITSVQSSIPTLNLNSNQSSRKSKFWLFILIGILFLLIVVISAWFIFKQPSDNGIHQNDLQTDTTRVEISINAPDTINTGQKFDGKYLIINNGDKFSYYLTERLSKKNLSEPHLRWAGNAMIFFVNKEGNITSSLPLCDFTDTGYSCGNTEFLSPGEYTFEVKIYDCADIKATFGNCSTKIDFENSSVEPLAFATKTVIVSGNATAECNEEKDCLNFTCENCKTGYKRCVLPQKKCIDCLFDDNCKEGYYCGDSHNCLEKKTCNEFGGIDCSSDRYCSCMGQSFQASDVDCCCSESCL